MTLEDRVNALEIDRELMWECSWGDRENLIKIYNLLHEEIAEVGALLYRHERADKTFKNELSETHKRYYEKFEILFRQIKTNASKRKPINASKLENIYKGRGGEDIYRA